MNYCDDCGSTLGEGEGHVITALPFPVASANAGESAILCSDCNYIMTMLSKRSDEAAMLIHGLLDHAVRYGWVTSESCHHIPVEHPNMRGACMKLLPRFGLKMGERRRGTTKNSHGHWHHRWELTQRSKAEKALRLIKSIVIPADHYSPDVCTLWEWADAYTKNS